MAMPETADDPRRITRLMVHYPRVVQIVAARERTHDAARAFAAQTGAAVRNRVSLDGLALALMPPGAEMTGAKIWALLSPPPGRQSAHLGRATVHRMFRRGYLARTGRVGQAPTYRRADADAGPLWVAQSAAALDAAEVARSLIREKLSAVAQRATGRLACDAADVLDTAEIQAESKAASEAMGRVIARYQRSPGAKYGLKAGLRGELVRPASARGEEVEARLLEGVFKAARTWLPGRAAKLDTIISTKVRRAVQARTKYDRPEGVRSVRGEWTRPAIALDAPDAPRPAARTEATELARDVEDALALLAAYTHLDSRVSEAARRCLLGGERHHAAAGEMGISVLTLRGLLAEASGVLREHLGAYAGAEDADL
jgi:DNA-directed RNA polymerase specialized sigma24 family protein